MSKGVSSNAPIVLAAQRISDAREKFEQIARKTNAHLVFEREARFALEIVKNSNALQSCDPETIYTGILNVAALGLSLNPIQGEAALIPRWNKKKGTYDCTLSPMYRGLVRLATESGRVSHIKAELVFADDTISTSFGTTPELHHDPIGSIMAGPDARVVDFIDPKRNRLKAAYVVAYLKNGEKIIGIMSYEELLKVALCSEAFNPKPDYKTGKKKPPYGPWVEHGGEMAKKTVINRDQKTWPRTSSEPDILDKAVEVMRDADEKEGFVSNQTAPPKQIEHISSSELKVLTELAERQSLSLDRVCEVAGVEKLDELPSEKFPEIKQKLDVRLQAYMERAKSESAEPKVEEKPAPKSAAKTRSPAPKAAPRRRAK